MSTMQEYNSFDRKWEKYDPEELETIMEDYLKLGFWVPYRHSAKEIVYDGEYYDEEKTIRQGMGKLTVKDCFGREVILYEGQFLCGAIHSENAELYDYIGRKEFEGVVFGGRRVTGKEYHHNGQLRYQGDFKENKPNGKNCIIYDAQGKVEFTGEVRAGE